MAPPFRADQVGSLLRPSSLLQARRNALEDRSEGSREELVQVQEIATKAAVQKQLYLAIRPITSGEYERAVFSRGFQDQLEGFSIVNVPFSDHRPGFPTIRQFSKMGLDTRLQVVATGKIKHTQSPYLNDWLYLRSLLPKEKWHEAKFTIVSPTYNHGLLGHSTYSATSGYSNDEEFFRDLIFAYQAEINILYEHGLRFLQIDDPNMSFFCDEEWVAYSQSIGQDLESLHDQHIKVHNELLAQLPKDLRVGVHLCRGNLPKSTHIGSGGYERIARKMFLDLNYDLYYLEFDTPRAGGFEPLRYLPEGKSVVLGLMSTKVAELEDKERLKERIMEAADIIAKARGQSRDEALNDLAISPQCGFSSMAEGGGIGVTEEIMWKKLELLRDVARETWRDAI